MRTSPTFGKKEPTSAAKRAYTTPSRVALVAQPKAKVTKVPERERWSVASSPVPKKPVSVYTPGHAVPRSASKENVHPSSFGTIGLKKPVEQPISTPIRSKPPSAAPVAPKLSEKQVAAGKLILARYRRPKRLHLANFVPIALDLFRSSSDEEWKKERNRRKLIREILTSEHYYVQQLQIGVKVFIEPLQQLIEQADADKTAGIISWRDFKTVFRNFRAIAEMQSMFLEQLDELADQYPTRTTIGGLFLEWMERFGIIYQPYVDGYLESAQTCQLLQRTSPAFADWVKARCLENGLQATDISFWLILPVQRLPRYELLLQELYMYLTALSVRVHHSDWTNVGSALRKLKEINKGNPADDTEVSRLLQATSRISDIPQLDANSKPFTINATGRKYVRDDKFFVTLSAAGKESIHERQQVFLFSDLLMICERPKRFVMQKRDKKYTYAMHVPLVDFNVADSDNASSPCIDLLLDDERRLTLYPKANDATHQVVDAWLKDLSRLKKEQQTKRDSYFRMMIELGMVAEHLKLQNKRRASRSWDDSPDTDELMRPRLHRRSHSADDNTGHQAHDDISQGRIERHRSSSVTDADMVGSQHSQSSRKLRPSRSFEFDTVPEASGSASCEMSAELSTSSETTEAAPGDDRGREHRRRHRRHHADADGSSSGHHRSGSRRHLTLSRDSSTRELLAGQDAVRSAETSRERRVRREHREHRDRSRSRLELRGDESSESITSGDSSLSVSREHRHRHRDRSRSRARPAAELSASSPSAPVAAEACSVAPQAMADVAATVSTTSTAADPERDAAACCIEPSEPQLAVFDASPATDATQTPPTPSDAPTCAAIDAPQEAQVPDALTLLTELFQTVSAAVSIASQGANREQMRENLAQTVGFYRGELTRAEPARELDLKKRADLILRNVQLKDAIHKEEERIKTLTSETRRYQAEVSELVKKSNEHTKANQTLHTDLRLLKQMVAAKEAQLQRETASRQTIEATVQQLQTRQAEATAELQAAEALRQQLEAQKAAADVDASSAADAATCPQERQ
eukprot:TRINITY_DN8065_c0_g1_i1.p1 TRINITY_DN8065_c0_g1~~TRINITY_DN8065_c0_g1_i1.p1  ORF type:complete len:1039 (-),score=320.26 TRINITY_DN8065_c0_g1_i1:172-3288(-)